MDLHGTLEIQTSPMTVWEGLSDPAVLARCVSGCDNFEQIGPGVYAASGFLKMGPVRSRIAVTISFAESDPPHRVVLHLTAKGAMASAVAKATILLHQTATGTQLEYDAKGRLAGSVGRFGGGRADASVQQLVGDFFARFAAAIPAEAAVTRTENPLAAEQPPETLPLTTPTPPTTPRRRKTLWIAIGAGAAATLAATAAILLTRGRTR